MISFTIARTGSAVDKRAALGYADAALADTRNVDLVGDGHADMYVGVYAFINRVTSLFDGSATELSGHIRNADGTWTMLYPEGQADPFGGDTDWVANVGWFDEELPELLRTLGVTVTASAGALGTAPVTLPKAT